MMPCNGEWGMVRKCLEIFEESPQIWWSNRYRANVKTCLKVKFRLCLEWLDGWAMEHDERIGKNRLIWGKIISTVTEVPACDTGGITRWQPLQYFD